MSRPVDFFTLPTPQSEAARSIELGEPAFEMVSNGEHNMLKVLARIVRECDGTALPISGDSYLPSELLDQARHAITDHYRRAVNGCGCAIGHKPSNPTQENSDSEICERLNSWANRGGA